MGLPKATPQSRGLRTSLTLFPEWKVYILPTGQVRWSQAVSKARQYVKVKFKLQRKGLTLYSARHTFKGFIDDLRGLSERSCRVVMGHASAIDTSGGYGPKSMTEERAEVILGLSNSTIERMTPLLLTTKERADHGELKIVEAGETTSVRTMKNCTSCSQNERNSIVDMPSFLTELVHHRALG